MTQRISKKTGRVYTVGSSTKRADWYPRTCYVCDERVLTSRPGPGGIGFYLDDVTGDAFAWHGCCASAAPSRKARVA